MCRVQVPFYRFNTCLGSSGPALSHRAWSFPMLLFHEPCCFVVKCMVGFLWSLEKPVTDICNEFSYCGLWACVLWITEACNECSVSRQWGGSPSGPLEQQFVVSGLEGGEYTLYGLSWLNTSLWRRYSSRGCRSVLRLKWGWYDCSKLSLPEQQQASLAAVLEINH